MPTQNDKDRLARGWPKSSLGSYGGGNPPPEPPMSPSGKSYYSKGDDPREDSKKSGKG